VVGGGFLGGRFSGVGFLGLVELPGCGMALWCGLWFLDGLMMLDLLLYLVR